MYLNMNQNWKSKKKNLLKKKNGNFFQKLLISKRSECKEVLVEKKLKN